MYCQYWCQLEALALQLLFLAEFPNLLKAMSPSTGSKREAITNGWSRHTITVAPPYMTLYQQIRQIRFQCYVDTQPSKEGQTFWTRNGVVVSCIKTNRVFACQNILIITKADVEDAGKYRCILSDNNSTYYTVAVIVPAFMRIQGDEMVNLSSGEGRLLDCGVSNNSYPSASSVYWKHNDKYVSSGPTLQLRNMNQNETGVYECTASNGYGSPASKKFYVSVDGVATTTVQATTVPLTTVPTSAIQNDSLGQVQVTDNVRVEDSNTVVSASASQTNHPFCLLYVVLCLVKQSADHFMY